MCANKFSCRSFSACSSSQGYENGSKPRQNKTPGTPELFRAFCACGFPIGSARCPAYFAIGRSVWITGICPCCDERQGTREPVEIQGFSRARSAGTTDDIAAVGVSARNGERTCLQMCTLRLQDVGLRRIRPDLSNPPGWTVRLNVKRCQIGKRANALGHNCELC